MNKLSSKKQFRFKEYEQFFRGNYKAASLIAFRYINDPSIVEDIVQEAFITLWEKRIEIYRNDNQLKNYLLITVRNKSISYLRSIKTKYIDIDSSIKEIEVSNDEKLIDDEELAVKVSNAITKLPEKCKEIFLLAYSEELSYDAIAERLSISRNTVKTQMVIAYRILRKELKNIYIGFLHMFSHPENLLR